MDKQDYMRPLSGIAIDAVEAITKDFINFIQNRSATDNISQILKTVEFRIDALSVVGSTIDEEKRLETALKQLKNAL